MDCGRRKAGLLSLSVAFLRGLADEFETGYVLYRFSNRQDFSLAFEALQSIRAFANGSHPINGTTIGRFEIARVIPFGSGKFDMSPGIVEKSRQAIQRGFVVNNTNASAFDFVQLGDVDFFESVPGRFVQKMIAVVKDVGKLV